MLDVSVKLSGFDEFINKLTHLSKNSNFVTPGFRKAVNQIRQTVIDGTPIGKPPDEHPGLMKRSWGEPKYSNRGLTATVTNSVDYGIASNYGHWQVPGTYVPALNARLVHAWVPGTYALERSLDEAEYQINPIIREELMRAWYSDTSSGSVLRETFYDRPGEELNAGVDYYE